MKCLNEKSDIHSSHHGGTNYFFTYVMYQFSLQELHWFQSEKMIQDECIWVSEACNNAPATRRISNTPASMSVFWIPNARLLLPIEQKRTFTELFANYQSVKNCILSMYLWASSLACDALSSVYVLNNSIITFVDFSLKKKKRLAGSLTPKNTSSFLFRNSGTGHHKHDLSFVIHYLDHIINRYMIQIADHLPLFCVI